MVKMSFVIRECKTGLWILNTTVLYISISIYIICIQFILLQMRKSFPRNFWLNSIHTITRFLHQCIGLWYITITSQKALHTCWLPKIYPKHSCLYKERKAESPGAAGAENKCIACSDRVIFSDRNPSDRLCDCAHIKLIRAQSIMDDSAQNGR